MEGRGGGVRGGEVREGGKGHGGKLQEGRGEVGGREGEDALKVYQEGAKGQWGGV